MKFSPDQQQAIDIRGTNVIVSASAGAGKTSVLVQRLNQMVLVDRIPVTSILAMSFTEDAAAEMKARLKRQLQAAAHDPWIADQLALLETASISTIDSFCYDLVKKYYYKIPISYAMSRHVENGPANRQAFQEALEHSLETVSARGQAALRLYYEAQKADRQQLETDLRRFVEMADAQPDPDAWIQSANGHEALVHQQFTDYFRVRLEALGQILEEMLEFTQSMEFAKASQQEKVLQDLKARLAHIKKSQAALDKSYDDFMETYVPGLDLLPRVPSSINKHNVKIWHTAYKTLSDQINSRAFTPREYTQDARNNEEAIEAFLQAALALRAEFAAAKKRRQILDFSDMEHFAWALLQDPMIREELQHKYETILVDEFQDTNDLQESIIMAIARGNNVFRVGDIKQSIYGFRQARPQIMERHMKSKDDKTLRLSENYRSTSTLVDFSNRLFSKIMAGFEEQDKMVPGTPAQSLSVQKPVRFLYTAYGDWAAAHEEGLVQAKKIHSRYRFDLIARDIIKKHKEGMMYRSICILTRTHGPHEALRQALEAYGIPAIGEVDHGFFTNQAVQIILSLLQSFVDPGDDIAMTAALCSSIGQVTMDELGAALASRPETLSIYQYLKDNPLMKTWNELYALRQLPVPRLIETLYGRDDWYTRCTTRQDKTNLDMLLDMAGQTPDVRLTDFVKDMLDQASLDRIGEASLYGKEEDVVRIRTIHHAKGLQYPLVYVLADSGRKRPEGCVSCDADMGIAFEGLSADRTLKYPSLRQTAFGHHRFMAELAEEMRIFYVAVTRAEQELVFVDTLKDLQAYGSPLKMWHLLSGAAATDWLLHTRYEDPSLFDLELVSELDQRPAGGTFKNHILKQAAYSQPVRLIQGTTASSAKKANVSWHPIRLHPQQATSRGTLFHEMAGQLSYPYKREEVLAYAARSGLPFTEADMEQFLALNKEPLYGKLMGQPHGFEESYIARIDGAIAHGFMDLVSYGEKEITIVDFKTDKVDSVSVLADRYKGQLVMYRCAMERIRPGMKVRTWIYSFYLNKMCEIL